MLRRALTSLVALAVAVATAAGSAGAETKAQKKQRQAEINAQIRTLREQVSEASHEESLLLDRLDSVQDRRRALDAKVAALDGQLATIERETAAAERRLDEMQADFVRAHTKLTLASEQLASAKGELRERAVAAYMGHPTANPAEIILRARTLRDLSATVGYLESIVQAQRRTVLRYTQLRDDTASLRDEVEAKKDAARAQRDVVVSRRSAIETVRAEQASVRSSVLSEERQQASLVTEVRDRKSEFQTQIALLQAESSSITLFLRGIQGGQGQVTGARGMLASPIPGATITSVFGPRVHPIFGDVRTHDGIDYRASMGTPIRTAAAGTVVYAGVRGGYGYATIIDHGGSLATLYAHQSAIGVSSGTSVARGQVIGAVGSTGFSTGPHLHFEVRMGGVPVDPLSFL